MGLRGQLDWSGLRVFQAVADKGSYNAAAKELGVSYGKVTKDVEDLEHALGHQLFERTSRGLILTGVGKDILQSARSMADSVRSILDRANDNTPSPVVICARDGIGSYWLARRLSDLLQRKPDARVSLRILPGTPSLLDGDGDIAIQFEPPLAANVVAKPLGWVHYIPYASPRYLARYGEPESMFDLRSHRCLRLSPEGLLLNGAGSAAPPWDAILPSAMETNAGTVLMEACAAGAGIAALPSYVSECDTKLIPLTHIKPLASFRFWLAYTERARNLPACAPVLQWLRDCFDPISHPCFREAYLPPKRPTDHPNSPGRPML